MCLCCYELGGMVRLGEKVSDRAGAEAREDEVSEIEFNIVRLVCPLILVGMWVEKLYIGM